MYTVEFTMLNLCYYFTGYFLLFPPFTHWIWTRRHASFLKLWGAFLVSNRRHVHFETRNSDVRYFITGYLVLAEVITFTILTGPRNGPPFQSCGNLDLGVNPAMT